MHFTFCLPLVIFSFLSTSTLAATCAQDNCYRALSNRPSAASSFCSYFTTSTQPLPPKTATPTLPFTTQCADSPYRLSSACSCIVPKPTVPTCQPTLALNLDGSFDQVFIEEGGSVEKMAPWYFDRLINTRGNFIREASGVSSYYGYGAAAWHIEGIHPPAGPNGGYLNIPLKICSGRTYNVRLYARKVDASPDLGHMHCSFYLKSRLYGLIGGSVVSNREFERFGDWVYTPDVEGSVGGVGKMGSVLQTDGSWNDTLSIWFGCQATDAPFNVLAEMDSVYIG